MEEKDCVLQVKYSIKLKNKNGNTPPLKKKIKRTYSSAETPVILKQIRTMNHGDDPANIAGPVAGGRSFYSTCKRFVQTWKCAYYEMLHI